MKHAYELRSQGGSYGPMKLILKVRFQFQTKNRHLMEPQNDETGELSFKIHATDEKCLKVEVTFKRFAKSFESGQI